MPVQALAAVATLVSFAVHGNNVDFQLDHGAAQLTWASARTFRFRRTLDGPLPQVTWQPPEVVSFQADDTPSAVRLRSKYIEVSIGKHGALVTVKRADGAVVMEDLTEPRAESGNIVWERAMPEGARYYGMGESRDPEYNLRGKAVDLQIPFLVSSAGYGEYHVGFSGRVHFDCTASDRYRIQAPQMDYFLYFGPTPKRIFEELHGTRSATGFTAPIARGIMTGFIDTAAGVTIDFEAYWGWYSLPEMLLGITHEALAGEVYGYFNLDAFAKLPASLLQRARQIGSLAPLGRRETVEPSDFSKQLKTLFASYEVETHDKGFPLWHPLPFQFPDDPECAKHADEFMLGDEMLIAPIYTPENRRSVYLPPGVWTNLETNAVEQGRRTIAVETTALPVFAHNGTIVPLDSPGGMALHYFPALGAEFFVIEKDVNEWTRDSRRPGG